MARSPRSDVFDPLEVSVFHCMNRCVRHSQLCGKDDHTGTNYQHRRGWIEKRLAFLARYFGIDVLSYAVLPNHFHLVVRNRPDIVAGWSDTEVAYRWLHLCPIRKRPDGSPEEPTEAELDTIRKVPKKLAKIRKRLSHISWMMGMLTEHIARCSNREEKRTGRFWEGRYRGIKLCDDAAVLACMAYVDLNPIRAGLACTPEASDFTSVQRRIRELEEFTRTAPLRSVEQCQRLREEVADLQQIDLQQTAEAQQTEIQPAEGAQRSEGAPQAEDSSEHRSSGTSASWLAPLGEGSMEPGAQPSRSGARCSDKAVLPIQLTDYLQLVEWTGRQLKKGQGGAIPEHLPPILERLGIANEHQWMALASAFPRIFSRVAGRPETIERERTRRSGRPFRPAKVNVFADEQPAIDS